MRRLLPRARGIVERDRIVARFCKSLARVRADITGSACDQDV